MIKRSLRHVLRRCGLDIPFRQVICTDDVKTVCIGPEMGAKVTVRRMLVFLDVPEPGDLHDTIPVEAGTEPETAYYASPDAVEIGRERRAGAVLVSWRPRTPIIPYGIYMHEYVWHPPGTHARPALYSQIRCDMRTGMLVLEMLTPGTFETAVVFRRPRWPRLTTERSLIKYALRRLAVAGERPVITDAGKRLEWKRPGPKVGDCYICVAFHAYGVAQWQERLESTSWIGRLRHFLRPLIPA
jgi:hypothetical protein